MTFQREEGHKASLKITEVEKSQKKEKKKPRRDKEALGSTSGRKRSVIKEVRKTSTIVPPSATKNTRGLFYEATGTPIRRQGLGFTIKNLNTSSL